MRIQTATIRRLRDALLKSGRRQEAVLSSAYETLARAGLISDEEKAVLAHVDPVCETMFLMMAADGKVTDNERDAVRGAIRGLSGDTIHDGTLKVMLENYERSLSSEGREERLRRIAAALKDTPSDAEGAFALAAAVALADDEVADEEQGLVDELAKWFGITAERANVILDQLEDDKT
jgi:tellurite resistance protein